MKRMHLMTFIEIARPNILERLLVLLVQGAFFNAFFCSTSYHPRRRIASWAISRKRRW